MAFARMLLSMMTTKQKETFPSPEAAGRTKSPRALLAGILRDVLPQLRHTGSFLILLTAFLVLLSCGPAPSGTPSGATVYSGSTYSLLGPTALVSVGSVPWYANATGNTLVGLVPDTGFELSGYAPVTISNPLSTFTTTYDLSDPVAMAVDLSGNLWVASQKNNSIVSLDSCFTGSNPNYNSCSVTGYQKNLDIPSGVAADPSGCTPGSCSPVVLSGASLGVSQPVSATFAQNGDLWVAEAGNNSATDMPSGCLSGGACQPIVYAGSAYPFGTPTSILAIGSTIWVLGASALVSITPSGP